MNINKYIEQAYKFFTNLASEVVKVIKSENKAVVDALDHKDVTEAILEAKKAIMDADNDNTGKLDEVIQAINDKPVAESVEISNINQLTDSISMVVDTLKEELGKIDKEIVVKNDLSQLTALFKSGADKKDLLKALRSIEDKIKQPEITDYTVILSDLYECVEQIKGSKVDLSGIMDMLAQIATGCNMEMPDHLAKYAKYDRLKVELPDKQVEMMASKVVAMNGGGGIQEPLISSNVHTGNKEVRVFQENHVCTDNTTTTPLDANETFTGKWQDCLNYQEVNVSVVADQNSATNGLVFQWSADGVNIGDTDAYSYYVATGGTNYTPNPAFRYVRMVYTNGATPQTSFSLQTILRRSMTGGSFHRIDSTLKDDSDGRLVISIPKLRTAQNNYISQAATNAGNAKVSIEEIEASVNIARSSIQTNGSQTTSIVDPNNSARKAEFDTIFKAPISIDVAHHEIHEGNNFAYCDVLALANGATQDYLITTPNTTKWSHFGYIIDFNDGAGSFDIYEAADRTGTTLQTAYNRNRNSATTAGVTIHKSVSGGTTDGTRICMRRAGARSISGTVGSGSERILKQNTKYIIRITNNTAVTNNVSVEFDWYEHTSE